MQLHIIPFFICHGRKTSTYCSQKGTSNALPESHTEGPPLSLPSPPPSTSPFLLPNSHFSFPGSPSADSFAPLTLIWPTGRKFGDITPKEINKKWPLQDIYSPRYVKDFLPEGSYFLYTLGPFTNPCQYEDKRVGLLFMFQHL